MATKRGAVHGIMNAVYSKVCDGYMDDVRKRIVRVQISLKTGLNLSGYGPETNDDEADVRKIVEAVRGPEIGLKDFNYTL